MYAPSPRKHALPPLAQRRQAYIKRYSRSRSPDSRRFRPKSRDRMGRSPARFSERERFERRMPIKKEFTGHDDRYSPPRRFHKHSRSPNFRRKFSRSPDNVEQRGRNFRVTRDDGGEKTVSAKHPKRFGSRERKASSVESRVGFRGDHSKMDDGSQNHRRESPRRNRSYSPASRYSPYIPFMPTFSTPMAPTLPFPMPSIQTALSIENDMKEREALECLLKEYNCGTVNDLVINLRESRENRSLKLMAENLKQVYGKQIASVQETTFIEMQKLCDLNVSLSDEIKSLKGNVARPDRADDPRTSNEGIQRQTSSSSGISEDHFERQMRILRDDLEVEVSENKELKYDIAMMRRDIQLANRRNSEYRRDLDRALGDVKREEDKTAKILDQFEGFKRQRNEDISGPNTVKGTLKAELDKMTSEKEQYKSEIDELREKFEALIEKNNSLTTENEQLKRQNRNQSKKIKSLEGSDVADTIPDKIKIKSA